MQPWTEPLKNEELKTPRPRASKSDKRVAGLALLIFLIAGFAFALCLQRLRGFYQDDVVFAFPALQAAQGSSFAFPGATNDVPFVTSVWAYHGPVLLNLEYAIFKVFGFRTIYTRLPDFLGAWAAAFLLLCLLLRRGYRWGSVLFAVLWSGDRAVFESMVGRMEGLAMACLAALFLTLERFWRIQSPRSAFAAGLLAGFSILIHPLCAIFAAISFLLVLYRGGGRPAIRFVLGGVLNLPLLIALWHFHPTESWIQFRYVAHQLDGITGLDHLHRLLKQLSWATLWLFSLIVVTMLACAIAGEQLVRHRLRRDSVDVLLLLGASFSLAGLLLLARSSLYKYYICYFSIWVIFCFSILVERQPRFRPLAAILFLTWLPSAFWNLARIREDILFYPKLSHRFVDQELLKVVPRNATVVTSSELYAIPIEDKYPHRGLVWFDPHQEDVCPACYLMITEDALDRNFVLRSNLERRKVLYAGPAFPGTGPLIYPVFIYSPESADPH